MFERGHELLFVGVFVHVVLLFSIFDVYYQSPLVSGLTPHRPNAVPPPAKRLVLFVADGLRAHSFFDAISNVTGAPFLSQLISTRASWGVSRTHVPTESRPGHVALIAGFYEDVSSVTKGWKENPVEFDSVFNQSRTTWSWGSPDILPMFAKGIVDGHVKTFSYASEFEDFASGDASKLDKWVFERVTEFFNSAKANATLLKMLSEDRIVFFLHLLGIDTTGHGYKPPSNEYTDNIKVVDEGIKNITKLIDDFYNNDDSTVYIFTSDHGMTDWGSHGGGTDHETFTPIVAWGAGIQSAGIRKPHLWHLTSDIMDIDQVDLAPLMSSLIGIAIPMNSVGRLPLSYIQASPRYLYHAVHANFRQMLAQLDAKRKQKKAQSFTGLFREFPDLTSNKIKSIEKQMSLLVEQKRFDKAAQLCHGWIHTIVRGLLYYHRYERTFLSVAIASIYISWMLLLFVIVKYGQDTEKTRTLLIPEKPFLLIASCFGFLLFIQSFAWLHILYCLLPIYLLSLVYNVTKSKRNLVGKFHWIKMAKMLFVASFVPFTVMTFFWRAAMSSLLLVIAIWPHLEKTLDNRNYVKIKYTWTFLCLFNAIFLFLPPVGQVSLPFINYISPLIIACAFLYYLVNNGINVKNGTLVIKNGDTVILMVSCILLLVSIVVVAFTHWSIERKFGLPRICQFWSWLILLICPIVPLFMDRNLQTRLFGWSLSLYLPYTLMTLSHESTFYWSFVCLLYLWLRIELLLDCGTTDLSNFRFSSWISESAPKRRQINLTDCRQACFVLAFTLLAFFGTGNLASLNSFNPGFVRCFVTVFQPFLMAALLFLKILIPFLLVAITMCGLEQITNKSAKDLMLIVLLLSDFMALLFFFLLKDSGSWLDIGTSISHYVICMLITVFIVLLYQIGAVITSIHANDIFADRKTHLL